MDTQKIAVNYAEYNLWANKRLIDWLASKPTELLHHEAPSSFSSMLKTFNHIWAIEAYWYGIITKKEDVPVRYGEENLDRDDVFNGLINCSETLLKEISHFSADELAEVINVKSPWFEANNTCYDYLHHIFNHSTYHRGQIVTIGRNAGITDAPMSDFLFFSIARTEAINN